QELISEIFEAIDVESIASCRLVCKVWSRIGTSFMFRDVVYNDSSSKNFHHIVLQDRFTAGMRTVTVVAALATDILKSVVRENTLQKLVLRPTAGVIRQYHQNKFVTTLTSMRTKQACPILPALREIRLISNEKPYLPTLLFGKLRKLHIDMECVQFETHHNWPLLEILLLRGIIDFAPLEAFLNRHTKLKQVQIATVSFLRPIVDSPGLLPQLLRGILGTVLSTDLVESIMNHATEHADGHERSFLQHFYAQLDKMTDEETAKDLRHRIVGAFDTMLDYEFELSCAEAEGMRVQQHVADHLEVSCSIEVL
ncbi:hypothetical protein EJ07DRAFT_143665, partial [Lizonia empirigonia]